MGYNILVVEDSPTMAQLLTFTLKKLKDTKVCTATDGVDGLKKLSGEKYDLVLTDINMPLMDGLTFLSLLRGEEKGLNKDVPVVIITTEGEDDVRSKGLKLGANSYITKPINSGAVINTVKELLAA